MRKGQARSGRSRSGAASAAGCPLSCVFVSAPTSHASMVREGLISIGWDRFLQSDAAYDDDATYDDDDVWSPLTRSDFIHLGTIRVGAHTYVVLFCLHSRCDVVVIRSGIFFVLRSAWLLPLHPPRLSPSLRADDMLPGGGARDRRPPVDLSQVAPLYSKVSSFGLRCIIIVRLACFKTEQQRILSKIVLAVHEKLHENVSDDLLAFAFSSSHIFFFDDIRVCFVICMSLFLLCIY